MNLCADLDEIGRVWIRSAFSSEALDELLMLCDIGARPGARLRHSPELAKYIGADGPLADGLKKFGVDAAPVRLVAFNKSRDANWSVPWHQDRVIAVAEKNEIPGYSNWIFKEEFWHCEPPTWLLEKMIFVRIHLDDCDESNGALELALGSHKRGLIEAAAARQVAVAGDIEVCAARRGDALVAKALIIHRSRSARTQSNRRALRADFAPRNLLAPQLDWASPQI